MLRSLKVLPLNFSIDSALLNDPDLILADEPTGNLDPETSAEIMNLLFEVSANKRAVVMITHNYSIIDKFPARIVKVDQGKVFETSTVGGTNTI
jgi:cell division transport system ATP-binding protein